MSNNHQTKISDYDKYKYDYRTYWQGRDYENISEIYALSVLMKDISGERIIDIGGSYGRLLPVYYYKFKQAVIVDYSLETLLKYEKDILTKFPNTILIAANVYHLPFKKASFDAGIMFRVLHHIKDYEVFFEELSTIFCSDSIYIQEFANKLHLKASLRWPLSGNLSMFDHKPYQQPSHGGLEGSVGETTTFLNYHPSHISSLLNKYGFTLIKKRGTSFLRISIIKKLMPLKLLILIEKMLQSIFSGLNITPSIIYKTRFSDKNIPHVTPHFSDCLCCPACKGKLDIQLDVAKCTKCDQKFEKHSTIWDFRTN